MSITWLPWHVDAFHRARAESKPVLLSISASWCPWCRHMDRTTYADPAVQQLVLERFVPVRVDADRRPDISDRYTLGGVPTTAFLTSHGELLGGGTYVPAERMPGVLERTAGAYAARSGEFSTRAQAHAVSPRNAQPHGIVSGDELTRRVFSTADRVHGGFGTAPKFPLTAPLHLALQLCASSQNPDLRGVVERTLDAMAAGGLHDEIDGGFFRCAETQDWRSPRHEKLLDVNADLLYLYVEASVSLQAERYLATAADVLRYSQTWLADQVDGGWAGSQQADGTYYSLATPEARSAAEAPEVDRSLYAGWNARMSSAALHAAQAFDDSALAEFAVKSLERIMLECYRPGGGVAHCFDGAPHVRGLLDDQILVGAAALDAFEATGDITYEMVAEELAYFALRTMWDEAQGGFFDRALPEPDEAVGLLSHRLKPFVSNCEAARLLVRLASSSGNHELRASAEAAIASLGAEAPAQGPLAAHYLLAMREAAVR
jgi:hypothetical protein